MEENNRQKYCVVEVLLTTPFKSLQNQRARNYSAAAHTQTQWHFSDAKSPQPGERSSVLSSLRCLCCTGGNYKEQPGAFDSSGLTVCVCVCVCMCVCVCVCVCSWVSILSRPPLLFLKVMHFGDTEIGVTKPHFHMLLSDTHTHTKTLHCPWHPWCLVWKLRQYLPAWIWKSPDVRWTQF